MTLCSKCHAAPPLTWTTFCQTCSDEVSARIDARQKAIKARLDAANLCHECEEGEQDYGKICHVCAWARYR